MCTLLANISRESLRGDTYINLILLRWEMQQATWTALARASASCTTEVTFPDSEVPVATVETRLL